MRVSRSRRVIDGRIDAANTAVGSTLYNSPVRARTTRASSSTSVREWTSTPATLIGAHVGDPDPAIQRAKGLDQNYAINGKPGTLRLAARLEDPKSGRVLEEWTTQPGLQVYSANYPPPTVAATKNYAIHSSVALEAQGFPNAPNIPSFPSTLLRRDDSYDEVTEYRFKVGP